MNSERRLANGFAEYHARTGADRNDVLSNVGARWQANFGEIGFREAIAEAWQAEVSVPRRALDVGCGSGGSLIPFIALGCNLSSCIGIDVSRDRAEEGRRRLLTPQILHGDATAMLWGNGHSGIVSVATMFLEVTDDDRAARLASEMLRVTAPGAHLIIRDWSTRLNKDETHRLVKRQRLAHLFPPDRAVLKGVYKGALLSPIVRFIRGCMPQLYQLAQLVPFATGQHIHVLRKV